MRERERDRETGRESESGREREERERGREGEKSKILLHDHAMFAIVHHKTCVILLLPKHMLAGMGGAHFEIVTPIPPQTNQMCVQGVSERAKQMSSSLLYID